MIIIKVISRRTGRPVSGALVKIHVGTSLFGHVAEPQRTDSKGEAVFAENPTSNGIVWVNSRVVRQGALQGTVVVNI